MSQVHDLALKLKRGAGSLAGAISLLVVLNASPAFACPVAGVTFAQLQAALQSAVAAGNGGLGFPMWATIVDRDGADCRKATRLILR
jgi:hypothetical protein